LNRRQRPPAARVVVRKTANVPSQCPTGGGTQAYLLVLVRNRQQLRNSRVAGGESRGDPFEHPRPGEIHDVAMVGFPSRQRPVAGSPRFVVR
jgi:hypothetical protein